MTFESQILRDAANGQSCVRCGKNDGTTCGAHYTGFRRLEYGGGISQKVHDFCIADLCDECHRHMDTLSRKKNKAQIHSEEFQHYVLLTIERRLMQGFLVVKGQREPLRPVIPKIVPRRLG